MVTFYSRLKKKTLTFKLHKLIEIARTIQRFRHRENTFTRHLDTLTIHLDYTSTKSFVGLSSWRALDALFLAGFCPTPAPGGWAFVRRGFCRTRVVHHAVSLRHVPRSSPASRRLCFASPAVAVYIIPALCVWISTPRWRPAAARHPEVFAWKTARSTAVASPSAVNSVNLLTQQAMAIVMRQKVSNLQRDRESRVWSRSRSLRVTQFSGWVLFPICILQ